MHKLLFAISLLFTSLSYAQLFDYAWVNGHGNSSSSYGSSVVTDAENNVYVVGKFEDTLDLDPGVGVSNVISNGGHDVFIQKLDINGNLIWAKSFGGTMNDFGWRIAVDNNNDVIVVGSYQDVVDFDPGIGVEQHTAVAFNDAYVLKLSGNGDFEWVATYGGTSGDVAFAMDVNSLNEIIVGGTFIGNVDFDPGVGSYTETSQAGGSDAYLLKLNADGSFAWLNILGGANDESYRSISIDNNDNIYASGIFTGTVDFDPSLATQNETSNGAEDSFVQKFDNVGNLQWARVYGGAGTVYSISSDVDDAGNVYTSGYFTGTADFDPGASVDHQSAGAGMFEFNIYIQKLDASGDWQWSRMIASPSGGEQPTDLVVNGVGEVFLTGYCGETTDFDPGVGVHDLTSAGSYDFFLLHLDTSGDYLWAQNWGGAMPDYTKGITVDSQGSLYLTGNFLNTVDFDHGAGVQNLTASNSDYFLFKISPEDLSVLENDSADDLLLYPNPSQGDVILVLPSDMHTAKVQISDVNGRIIQIIDNPGGQSMKLNLEGRSGIYLVSVESKDRALQRRLVLR